VKVMKANRRALLKKNSGFTLVEILVALFFITVVLGSIMGIFVESIKSRSAAEKVTRANAAAQKFAESLYAKSYSDVLALQGEKMSYNGFYLSFKVNPQGNGETASTDNVSYVHIVFTSSGGCLIVAPDGTYASSSVAPFAISVSATSTTCTVSYDGVPVTSVSSGKAAVIVYAMQKPSATTTSVELGTGVAGVLYCKADNAASIPVTGGTWTVYNQTVKADKTLIRTVMDVYETVETDRKLTAIESIIQVANN